MKQLHEIDEIIKKEKNKKKISFSWGFEYRFLQELTDNLYNQIVKKYNADKNKLILIRLPSISVYENLHKYLNIKRIFRLTPDLVCVEGEVKKNYMLYLNGTLAYLLPGQSYLDAMYNLDNEIEVNQASIDGEFSCRIEKDEYVKQIISSEFNVSTNQIVFNWGSGGSIELILWSLINKFKKNPYMLINVPNYFYTISLAQKFGYKIKNVLSYYRDNYRFPFKTMLKELKSKRYDIIVLTSPNNPFGIQIEKNQFYELLKNLPNNTYALLDFTGLNDNTMFHFRDVLNDTSLRDKKILMLDSLSKNYEMCHARAGILITSNIETFNDLNIQAYSPILTLYAYYKLEEALGSPGINKNVIKKHKKYYKILKSLGNENFRISSPHFSNFVVARLQSGKILEKLLEYIDLNYDHYDLPFRGGGKFDIGIGNITQDFIPFMPKNNLRLLEETAELLAKPISTVCK